jgi:uncharacterized membrane protein HdeD (DUF308 family)
MSIGIDGTVAVSGWAKWTMILLGCLGVAAGVIVLVEPSISLVTLAVISGIFLLLDGLIELLSSLSRSVENRGLVALFGAITAIVGVLLIRHPDTAVVAIALLLGLWLLVIGILRLVGSFAVKGTSVWTILLGLFEVIAGIVIVSTPKIGVATLALFIGIAWIARGLVAIVVGWTLRTEA